MRLQFLVACALAVLPVVSVGADAPADRSGSAISVPGGGTIDLAVTISAWSGGPIDCGTSSILDINAGDWIGVCYTVTNHTGRELDWHYLDTILSGNTYFSDTQHFDNQIWNAPLPDGGSLQFTEPARTWTSTDLAATWTAQDASPPGYTFDDTVPFDFIDLSTSPTATVLMATESPGAADADMPFAFRFYEASAENVLCVGFRGAIFVGQPGCDPTPHDSNFEQMPIPQIYKLIAPAWTVWGATLTGGTVYTDTQGVAPNRRFIVEWAGMTRNTIPGPGITFEAVIDEATSDITFQYLSMAFDDGDDPQGDYGGYSTVGIQRDGTASDFTQYSWWEQVLTDGKAIRWTPAAMPFSVTATASARIEVLAPAITVTPSALEASAPAGTSTTASLTIGNAGNMELDWTLASVPAGTGFHISDAYAPSEQYRRSAPAGSGPHPAPSGGAVPAYAIAYGPAGSRYVSFDASAPQTLTLVNNVVTIDAVQVGSFFDNDFTREYLATNGGCNDDTCFGFEFGYVETSMDPGHYPYSEIGSGGYLAPTVTGEFWHGVKWDATSNTVFGVASLDNAPSQTDLYSIDPHTGTPTWIAQIDSVGPNGTKLLDIAIAPNGNMYGIDEWTDTLFGIDKTTGHVVNIGPTGLDAGNYDLQSMDFDQATGVLYYAAFPLTPTQSGIYTMDLLSGAASLVAPINGGTDALRAFSIAVPGGPCTNPGDVPWLAFDQSSGTTAPGGDDDVTVTFDAGGLAAGTYQAKLCIGNNTPFQSTLAVPVEFVVTSNDAIFANGFESN